MMIRSKNFDIGLILLLAFNLYAIYFYTKNPNAIGTLILIFWMQSVFIGVFNFIGILSFTNRVENSFMINNNPGNKPGCAAFFFLFHYGTFHIVYLVFIVVFFKDFNITQYHFIKLSFWAILAGSVMQFLQDKKRNATVPVNIGSMFVLPYVRIVPMHLVILLPKFFSITPSLVFVIFKLIADLVMHVAYYKFVFNDSETK
ncbi:MAG: hypothetical protein IT251_10280 [Chitinophagaceae bacterium]|nr:hypothetical protein [Chitinophagaceae bacterium]